MNTTQTQQSTLLASVSRKTALALALAGMALAFAAPLKAAQAVTTTTTTTTSSSGSSFATSGSDPFAIGEKVIFAGLSAGGIGYYGNTAFPPLIVGFDYAFHEYMTLGGIFGYSRYDYSYIGSSDDLTYLTFAARGTFHPTFWFKRMRVPLDPYGVATVGYTVGSYSGPGSRNYSIPVFGPSVGARYWFLPNLSGQAEAGLGYGTNLFSIALAFKL